MAKLTQTLTPTLTLWPDSVNKLKKKTCDNVYHKFSITNSSVVGSCKKYLL